MFNFKEVKEMDGNVPTIIRPGVRDVKITNVEYVDDQKPYIKFSFSRTEEDVEQTLDHRFYMTENAAKWSAKAFKHMALQVGTEEAVNEIQTPQDLADFLIGKRMFILFKGREYEKQDGDIGTATDIGLPPFAEPLHADGPKELSFDKERDIKKLATPQNDDPVEDEGTSLY